MGWVAGKSGIHLKTPGLVACLFKSVTLSGSSMTLISYSQILICLLVCVKKRLLTKDCMIHYGINVDPTCVLCGNANEFVHNLLFDYPYYDCIGDACHYELKRDEV